MKVKELMGKNVFSCMPEDNLREAAGLMLKNDCGILPVVDEERAVLGMITDRDICMCGLMEGGTLDHLPVSRAMSKEIWGLRPEDSFADACQAMQTHGVRRLPVMDEKHHLLGIVGLGDLVAAAADKKKGAGTRELIDALVAVTTKPAMAAKTVKPAPATKTVKARS